MARCVRVFRRALLGPPRARCDQFASVPSKSIVACVPSQNGLFDECPQRHIAIGSGCSITRPSGAVRTTGPATMYGPSSLGVMVTSAMCCDLSLVDLDRLGEGELADSRAGQGGDRVRQGRGDGGDADLADSARWFGRVDQVHLHLRD